MSLQDYRFQYPVTVRFADLDALGHLNNAKYLTYVEQARIEYVRQVCGWSGDDWSTLGMILARTEIDYQLPVHYEMALSVYTRVSRIGSKSFDFTYQLVDTKTETVMASALTIMVAFDYQTQDTILVPEAWRDAIHAYEPSLSDE